MTTRAITKLANAIKLSNSRLSRDYYNNTRIGKSIGKGLGVVGGGALGAGALTSGLLANSVINEAIADPVIATLKYLPAREYGRAITEFMPAFLEGSEDKLNTAIRNTSRESIDELLANIVRANKGLTAAGIGGGLLAGGALGGAVGSGLGSLGGAIATPVTSSVGYLVDKLKPAAPKNPNLTSILRKALMH